MTTEDESAIDALVAAGDLPAATARAGEAFAADPTDEGLLARWMLGLARTGRPGDALRAFQQGRHGLEHPPSDWVVALERAIALRDPAVTEPDSTPQFIPSRLTRRSRLASGRPLPQGVITFLMTDVVGSTRLWETVPRAMRRALARHDEIIGDVVESHDGSVVRERGEGDSTFSVFSRATDAAATALTLQLCLADEPWARDCPIVLRTALHTGEASERDGDYYGRVVNRTARLRELAQPGQTLVSESTAQLVLDHLPVDTLLVSLGVQHLKDMDRPERVYLLVAAEPDEPGAAVTDEHVPDGEGEVLDAVDATDPPARWAVVLGTDRAHYDTHAEVGDVEPDWSLQLTIPLTRPSTSVGRANPANGLRPDIDVTALTGDAGVSRSHAVLEWDDDGGLSVVDLGSTNGTYLGDVDRLLAPTEPQPLADGDRIFLGAWTVLEIHAVDDPLDTSTAETRVR